MMQEDEIQIRKIEEEIDNFFRSQKFMQLNRSTAIQYLLVRYEAIHWSLILSGEQFTLQPVIESAKQSLMHSINWASEISRIEPKGIVIDIDEDIYATTARFFDTALSYHKAVSAYTLWNRGFANATLLNDHTVRFDYSAEELRYDVLDQLLNAAEVEKNLEATYEADRPYLEEAKEAICRTVRENGRHTISYSAREVDCNEMMSVASNMIRGHTIPPYNWQFEGIPVDCFEKFWRAIVSICVLHMYALRYAFEIIGKKKGFMASTIVVRSRGAWVMQLSRWTGLSREIISKIIDYHTYFHVHKKPDIVLTPFVHVTEKHLALAPTLITTNNLGRNLLKHLAKNHKDEYDRNSGVFEDSMISEFCGSMKDQYFEIIPKARIIDSRGLPDIDILLIDETRCQVMVCEFKWTIPAAEPSEILEKMEIEKKALSQLSALRNHIYSQKEKNINISKASDPVDFQEIFFIGVLKNCVGTNHMFNEEMPIVDYHIFCEKLGEKKSLGEEFSEIKESTYLPQKDIDFEIFDDQHMIGGNKIIWCAFKTS